MDRFYHNRRSVGKTKIVLGGPDLWKDLTNKNQYESNDQHFDDDFHHSPRIVECNELGEQVIQQYDYADIHKGSADQQGSIDLFGFFQQGNNSFRARIVFCLQHIDILTAQREKGHFRSGDRESQEEQDQ